MKQFFSSLLMVSVLFVLGCAAPAQFENMTYEGIIGTYDSELNGQIELAQVKGGSKTNPLWTSQISNEDFQRALEQSLVAQGLLSQNGRFTLKATLIEVAQPWIGVNLKVATKVNYVMIDEAINDVLLDEVIEADFTATFSDAFDAVTRLKIANEGSAKANIKRFLERLALLRVESDLVSLQD